jgi:hypothetical protein
LIRLDSDKEIKVNSFALFCPGFAGFGPDFAGFGLCV